VKLVSARPLVRAAHLGRYAVPAFNTNSANYDITRAALEAAQAMRSPLILQEMSPTLRIVDLITLRSRCGR
jgi:fructose/tagatose bisphosphate aldolase